MSTNDYQHSAANFALREITGTDAVAFHKIAERIAALKLTGRAVDVGCGAGRSTRFLQSFGLHAEGIDVSEAMVAEARRIHPAGKYHTYAPSAALPWEDAAFDVLLSMWVVLEIASLSHLDQFLREAARVLRVGGRGFIVANTEEFYRHRWVSCEVDFPENQAPLRSGQRVKARLMPEGVQVTDTYWSDADYRAALQRSGLQLAHAWHPLAPAIETTWLDETKVAPWVVYEFERAQ